MFTMTNNKIKITFWKENRTGIIYKFYNNSPANETAWTRSTDTEYHEQLAAAYNKYMN